jgi:galactokinase
MDQPREIPLFVGGRLCLFGEHSDWASEYGLHKGYCLVIGTDQGLRAVASPSDEFAVRTALPAFDGRPAMPERRIGCRWDAAALLDAAQDQSEFFRYCAGVAHQMLVAHRVPGGIELRITSMDLPLRKGVSSSAAVCTLVARAFDAVYGLGLFPHELMELAYLGERLTGSQCGRMDQACIYGKTPVLLTFEKSASIRVEPVFPAGEISMFFVDLAGRKDTVRILADLQRSYLASRDLQLALGSQNEAYVREAYRALGAGDAAALGRLMTQAQANFDAHVSPFSRAELTSPLLHQVLGLPAIAEHIYGGKGVGSQGDGTAQIVARSRADRDAAMAKVAAAFSGMRCFPLTITPAAPPKGA